MTALTLVSHTRATGVVHVVIITSKWLAMSKVHTCIHTHTYTHTHTHTRAQAHTHICKINNIIIYSAEPRPLTTNSILRNGNFYYNRPSCMIGPGRVLYSTGQKSEAALLKLYYLVIHVNIVINNHCKTAEIQRKSAQITKVSSNTKFI